MEPNKTQMGDVAWNSREIYSAKKTLHICAPFSSSVLTQTLVLILTAEKSSKPEEQTADGGRMKKGGGITF